MIDITLQGSSDKTNYLENVMKVLVIKSSLSGENSISSKLADLLVDKLPESYHLTTRDLGANPLPTPTQAYLSGRLKPTSERTPEESKTGELADSLIVELQEADLIVIASPMYNFSVSANLKTWIDYVAQFGKTFTYSENGPAGLIQNKRAIVINTMGGPWAGSPADFLTGYVPYFLGFLGIKNVAKIIAQNTASTPDKALEQGSSEVLKYVSALG